ncbi:MAG: TonB family protein [Bacteroidales bacterium]|nr:TonB family protein [Bacteroidales bacterium]
MKRLFINILFAVLTVPALAQFRTLPGLDDSETVRSFREHVTTLSAAALEGRKAGSEGEKAAAAYVDGVFRSYGLDMLSSREGDLFGLAQAAGDTLTSRNVAGVVQGYDPKLRDRYIVIGARLDNLGVNHLMIDGQPAEQIYYGANGNASGLAMLMELARMIRTHDVLFRRSVVFVAFGASQETFAGAWYFLNRSFADAGKIDGMINLDMLGAGQDGFCAYAASNADMEQLLRSMQGSLQPVYPAITAAEPYPSDHRAFYAKEIPSVFFSTGQYPEHNTDRDTGAILDYEGMERELEYIYGFSRVLANTDRAPLFKTEDARRKTDDRTYMASECDQRPTFMGYADPRFFLEKWVYQYLRYPQAAVEQGIQGRVIVDFVIDTDGKVVDVEVTRGVHLLLDEEAVRVVEASPKWKPARIQGRKVRSVISIPVEFKLERKSKGSFGIKK